MRKIQKTLGNVGDMKKLIISNDVSKFGGTETDNENVADIVAKWPSGIVWAVRIQKNLKDRELFKPRIPKAIAVIAVRKGDDIEFFSASSGDKLVMGDLPG